MLELNRCEEEVLALPLAAQTRLISGKEVNVHILLQMPEDHLWSFRASGVRIRVSGSGCETVGIWGLGIRVCNGQDLGFRD